MSHIELVDALPPDATAALETSLRDYNRDHNPGFWNARELPANAARPLNVCARSAEGQGIGARLMQLAEAEATRRGCQYAYVDTMDYQAPDFYQRLGYTIAGQLDNWDSHGHAKLFLVKRLSVQS